MDHVAHGLTAAADTEGNICDPLMAGTGQDDLGAAQDKGVRRTKIGFQRLLLRQSEWSDE